jgi:PAS domain S-box-containing protein
MTGRRQWLLAGGLAMIAVVAAVDTWAGVAAGAGAFAFSLLRSDRRALELEVESLEAQQSAALGSLAQAITVQDADGRLVYANQAAAETLGFASAAELLATPNREIVEQFESFNEDGTPLRVDQFPGRRVLAGETPEPLLIRAIHRASGEERWRLTRATPVLDPAGRPRLAVNVMEDVTEVKRAELAQRFLARAAEAFASSMDYEETLSRLAAMAVPELADWCTVSIPDDAGVLRGVAVAARDPEQARVAREFDERHPARLSDPGGAAQVIRDGSAQLINEIDDAVLERTVADPRQRDGLRALGIRAAMIVPMLSARRVIGVINFVSTESRRTFTEHDLELAEELGRRAGTAVENARLYTERTHIARTLQASLLPDRLPDIPGFALSSLYRPAGAENFVGGDFYDAFPTPSGWMLMVGDVTGRGAEAASLTAQARHTLRTAGTLLDDPRAAIEQLNRALTSPQEVSICTVAAIHLTESGPRTTATIVCAGHPQPLLVREGRARTVGLRGPMVGAWPDSEWEAVALELQPDDVLVVYTDGVTDARGREERFGEERLAVTLNDAADAEEAVAAVRDALAGFEVGEQADDTALVALQRLRREADGRDLEAA